ncbi:MAG TPA: NnrU family protein [Caulobacterales bacterium]|nr:NnrU family protein [Caulobacterales bacterium]
MSDFTAALAAFVLLHVGVSATGLRAVLVSRIGEGPYRGLFSLASLALLIWLVHAYGVMRADPANPLNSPVWAPPQAFRYAAYVFVLVGFLLGVAGVLTPGPTLAGFEGALRKPEPATGVLRITRHPFLWGVALWACGHLLVNGERFAVMLFGALGLMALLGTRSIDRKRRARDPEDWARFAAATSNVPFAAIAQGRNTLRIGEFWLRALIAILVFAAVGYFHGALIGVPAFPASAP